MTKEEICSYLKTSLIEILPELEGEEISIHESLSELGANSIDRGELVSTALEHFDVEIPRITFATAETIESIATLIANH